MQKLILAALLLSLPGLLWAQQQPNAADEPTSLPSIKLIFDVYKAKPVHRRGDFQKLAAGDTLILQLIPLTYLSYQGGQLAQEKPYDPADRRIYEADSITVLWAPRQQSPVQLFRAGPLCRFAKKSDAHETRDVYEYKVALTQLHHAGLKPGEVLYVFVGNIKQVPPTGPRMLQALPFAESMVQFEYGGP